MAMKGRVSTGNGRRSAIQGEIDRLKAQVADMDKSAVAGFVRKALGVSSRIVLLAFNKHIATELNSRITEAKVSGLLVKGSQEQEAVWKELIEGDRHIVVNAVAGSGKTFTLVQGCLRTGAQVEAMTYHSLGMKACTRAFGRVRVDEWKTWGILDGMSLPVASQGEKVFKARVAKMVSLVKQYGREDRKSLEWIVDRHDVELEGMDEAVLDVVPRVLARCKQETSTIDFDDMVWLPYALGLSVPKFDVVMSDEAQDLNIIQQYLAMKAGDRHVVVGDRHQAIYGFRGSDSMSMDSMKGRLEKDVRGVVEMPLTLTRRCPKQHVELAKLLVPEIRAMDDAPDGKVSAVADLNTAVGMMKPGDMVICRVNAELLKVAYKLLRKGIKAVVRGKDIGLGIVKLVDKAELVLGGRVCTVPDMVREAGRITDAEAAKFLAMPNGRGEMRASAVVDKYDCLVSISEGARDSQEVKRIIQNLFSDVDDKGNERLAVVLSSVHRGKGLEAGRVFVLRPDLMPHPMAKQKHDMEQEMNLLYVAVTRAKFEHTSIVFGSEVTIDRPGELVFVGGVPGTFGGYIGIKQWTEVQP